jgi:hypothetical protein
VVALIPGSTNSPTSGQNPGQGQVQGQGQGQVAGSGSGTAVGTGSYPSSTPYGQTTSTDGTPVGGTGTGANTIDYGDGTLVYGSNDGSSPGWNGPPFGPPGFFGNGPPPWLHGPPPGWTGGSTGAGAWKRATQDNACGNDNGAGAPGTGVVNKPAVSTSEASSNHFSKFTKMNFNKATHAVLACFAFLGFFPFGGGAIRLMSFPGIAWFHAACQILGLLFFTVAFGIGIELAQTLHVVSFIAIVFQVL